MSFMTGEGLAGTGRLSEHHERLLGNDSSNAHFWNSRTSTSGARGGSGYPPRRGGAHRDSNASSVLFNAYEEEEPLALAQLNESEDEEDFSPHSRQPGRTTMPLRQTHARGASVPSALKKASGAIKVASPTTPTHPRPLSIASSGTSSIGRGGGGAADTAATPTQSSGRRSPGEDARWTGVPYVAGSTRR